PAASSGLSKPESAASYATRLTAANRRLMVVGARRRCSKWIRYRRTTVRLKASRGSEQYQSTNSLIAGSYVRWPLFEVRLFSTADFVCSRSGRARDRFGGLLFLRCLDILGGLLRRLSVRIAYTLHPWPLALSRWRGGRYA